MAAKTKVGIENGKLIIENFMITSLTGSYERPLLVGASGNLSSSYTSSLSVENGGTGLDYIGEANQLLGVYVTGGIAQYKTLHGENLTVNFYADVSGTIGLTASLDMPLISSSFSSGNFGYINENGYIVDSGWTARDFNASGNFEASHSQGTDVQFYRGDKTWQNTSSMGFIPRISGSFVSGNFGYINENGYLVDSGWNAADFEPEGNYELSQSNGTVGEFWRGDKTWAAIDLTTRELSHSQGTISQYYRGDKTWQEVSQFEVSRSLGTDTQFLGGNNTWRETSSMQFIPYVTGGYASGNFSFFNANGYLADSNKNIGSFEVSYSQGSDVQYYTGLKGWANTSSMGFIPLVSASATSGNFCFFNGNKFPADSGKSAASFELSMSNGTTGEYLRGDKTWAAIDLTTRELSHSQGTTAQYYRGDKTWQAVSQFEVSRSLGTDVQYLKGNNTWASTSSMGFIPVVSASATSGNFAFFNSNKFPADSGKNASSFEISHSQGTTAQYYRGDKTWQAISAFEVSRSLGTTGQYLAGNNTWANTSSMGFMPIGSGSVTSGNLAIMNENKFAVDSGYSMANVISGLSYATGLVTTTDATTTTIITQAIAASTVYHVDTIIVASSSQAKLASYRLQATVYGSGSTATILGDITSLHTVETDTNWNATYATNAGNLLVQVSGAIGTTIKWKAAMNYLGVS